MNKNDMDGQMLRLIQLFALTNFSKDDCITWEDIKVDTSDGCVYVPQGSTLGETLISLGDTYENSGNDCMFIQRVIEFFRKVHNKIRQDASAAN